MKIGCSFSRDGVSVVTVVVTITDINDSPPIFQLPNYYVQINEVKAELKTFNKTDDVVTINRAWNRSASFRLSQ